MHGREKKAAEFFLHHRIGAAALTKFHSRGSIGISVLLYFFGKLFIFLFVCASVFMYGIANIYWKIQTRVKTLAKKLVGVIFFSLGLLIVWLARKTLSPLDVMSYNELQQFFNKKTSLCTLKPVDMKTLASYQTCINV